LSSFPNASVGGYILLEEEQDSAKLEKMYFCSTQGVRGIPAAEIIAKDGDASYYKQTNNRCYIEAMKTLL
jgi:hypothetical protein